MKKKILKYKHKQFKMVDMTCVGHYLWIKSRHSGCPFYPSFLHDGGLYKKYIMEARMCFEF